jgi:hypothetical protein
MSLLIPAITGVGSILGNLIGNKGASRRQQQADRQNIKFWQMQNQYNDPIKQMARLKKAGLNPNLVYGQSVSGATGQAGAVAPSKAAPYQMDIGSAAQNSLRAHQVEAQVDNTEVNTLQKLLDYNIDEEFAREIMEQKAQNIALGNAKQLIENNVLNETAQDRIKQATTNLSNAKATLEGQKLKNAILQFDADMKDMGISGQSWYATLLKFLGFNIKQGFGEAATKKQQQQEFMYKKGYIYDQRTDTYIKN